MEIDESKQIFYDGKFDEGDFRNFMPQYSDEVQVGNAIHKSGIAREDIFLTTKVWIEHYGYEQARASALESMEKLQTDYLDLCLLQEVYHR